MHCLHKEGIEIHWKCVEGIMRLLGMAVIVQGSNPGVFLDGHKIYSALCSGAKVTKTFANRFHGLLLYERSSDGLAYPIFL